MFDIREESIGYFQAGNGSGLLISAAVLNQAYGLVWPELWQCEWL